MATRGRAPSRPARPPAPARPRPPWRPRPAGPPGPPILGLLVVPALITLGVTLLRLGGELRGGPPFWFSRVAGGGLAVVGIAWLVPIFGAWFGYRLGRAGARPGSLARAAGLPLAALGAVFLLAAVAKRIGLGATATAHISVWAVSSLIGVGIAIAAWPALGRVLLAYALLVRVPVVAVMWLAITRRWGTHYDAPPPGFPAMPPLHRWLWTGVVPQMTIWVAWTVVLGALFGALGFAVATQRRE